MTTITVEKAEGLSKTSFTNLAELRQFLIQGEPIDLVYVEDEAVPDDIIDLVKQAKTLPSSAFTNI